MANGTKLKKPYNRDLCLERLADHAIRPVNAQKDDGTSYISHLETPQGNLVGLKLWSYINFLGYKLVRI